MIVLGVKGNKSNKFFIKVWRNDGTIEATYENVGFETLKNVKKYCKSYKVLAIAIADIPDNKKAIEQNK